MYGADGSGMPAAAGISPMTSIPVVGDIPQPARAVIDSADAFVSRPDEEEKAVRWDGNGQWSGWQPLYAAGGPARPLERDEIALRNLAGWPCSGPTAHPASRRRSE